MQEIADLGLEKAVRAKGRMHSMAPPCDVYLLNGRDFHPTVKRPVTIGRDSGVREDRA